MKVLVLSAHPDDLELSCGGTISKMKSMGATIDNFILCPYQDHKKYLITTSAILGFNPIQIEHYETKWIEGRLTDKKFDELSKLWRKIGYKVFTRKEMDKWLES